MLLKHICLQVLSKGAAASVALVAVVSLVSILQTGDWTRVSTLARHYFSPYITTIDWHQDCTACCAGHQWVGLPLVSVEH